MADTKVVITAETGQAESSLISLGRHVDGVSDKFTGFSGIAGSLAGVLSITAFGAFIKNSIDAANRLDDLSQQTGTTVEQLAGLKYAAEQNGASLESVAKGAAKISAAMADKPELFERFGISAKDSTGAMIQLADVFAGMPDGIEKSALATKLFGDRVGGEMVLFLNQGSEAMRKNIEIGQEYNPITTESAAAAAQFNDNLDLLITRGLTPLLKIANDLLPKLNDTVDAFVGLTESSESFLPIGGAIKTVFETLVVLGANVGYVFKMVGNEIGGIASQLAALATGDFKGAQAIGEAMRSDAAKARADIDAFSERIINGRPAAAASSQPSPAANPSAGRAMLAGFGGGDKDGEAAARDQARIDAQIAREQAKFDKLSEMAILYSAKEQDRVTWKLAFDLEHMEKDREMAIANKAWNEDLEASYQQARIDREAMAVEEIGKLRQKELEDKQKKDALEIQFMRASFQYKKSMRIADLGNALDLLSQATQGMASHSRAAFEVNKAATIAGILVKAPKIITGAYDSGQEETGSWWGGVAYAAAATLAVGAQLSAAQGASFGGGGSVAPASGGTAGMPASSAAQQSGTAPNAGASEPPVSITIYNQGNVLSNDYVESTIIPQIKDAVQNRDVLLFDSRSRQAQALGA